MATPYKIKTQDGTAAAPAHTFDDDTNTGTYRIGADELGVSAGGVKAASFTSDAASLPTGAVDAPGVAFLGDLDTGIYQIGANNLGIASGGTVAIDVSETSIGLAPEGSLAASVTSKQILVGTAGGTDPQIASATDSDTGLVLDLNTVNIHVGGSQKLLIGSSTVNFENFDRVIIPNDAFLQLRGTTVASLPAPQANFGHLYMDGSDESLYYVNESNETFIVNMTAV